LKNNGQQPRSQSTYVKRFDNSNLIKTSNSGFFGNKMKDINLAYQGYKYPDRVYGTKFNSANKQPGDTKNPSSALAPKTVHKPI
jgi:hypothetical protein